MITCVPAPAVVGEKVPVGAMIPVPVQVPPVGVPNNAKFPPSIHKVLSIPAFTTGNGFTVINKVSVNKQAPDPN